MRESLVVGLRPGRNRVVRGVVQQEMPTDFHAVSKEPLNPDAA